MLQVSKVSDLHERWSKDPDYRAAFDELGSEFDLTRAMIEAVTVGCPIQAQPVARMKAGADIPALMEKCSSTGPA